MTKSESRKSKNKNNKKKQKVVGSSGGRLPKRVSEIVFDAEAREKYLKGFSERKKQRRVFGLAMQKVKDRKYKLEQRAEMKKAVEEQIVEAERRKNIFADGTNHNELDDDTSSVQSTDLDLKESSSSKSQIDQVVAETEIAVYEDEQTQSKWGGEVIVTTKTNFSDDDEEDEFKVEHSQTSRIKRHTQSNNDTEQEYSGKVERYIRELKGKMPSSTKTKQNQHLNQPRKQRGKHGATAMQGIGGDGNFKLAKKILSRTQTKVDSKQRSSNHKKKNIGKRKR